MAVSTGVCASANVNETAYDSQFLNDMGLAPNRYGNLHVTTHWGNDSNMVDKAWGKMGVTCTTNCYKSNSYSINGKKVKRAEAYKYVADKLGKNCNYGKYDPEEDKKAVKQFLDTIYDLF